MNVETSNVFLLTSRLRNISITEIIWGALALATTVWNSNTSTIDNGWNIFHVVCATLLLATGILGVFSIHRLRNNIQDVHSFRALGACNVILCTIDSITLIFLLIIIVMLLYWEKAARHILGTTILLFNDKDDPDAESRRHHTEGALGAPGLGPTNVVVYVVFLIVTGIYSVLTAVAAVFSFRISATLFSTSQEVPMPPHDCTSILPPAEVPLLSGRGYGCYPAVSMQSPPVYTSDAPFKQNLGY